MTDFDQLMTALTLSGKLQISRGAVRSGFVRIQNSLGTTLLPFDPSDRQHLTEILQMIQEKDSIITATLVLHYDD